MLVTWRNYFATTFFSQAVTTDDDSGIIATPLVTDGGQAIYPLYFLLTGTPFSGDETNDVTIEWYVNAAGTGGAIGTTTFAQLLNGTEAVPLEVWPGDVNAFDGSRDLVPLFPLHQVLWDTAGAAPTPDHTITITMGHQVLGG